MEMKKMARNLSDVHVSTVSWWDIHVDACGHRDVAEAICSSAPDVCGPVAAKALETTR
jgi:hypothetical protein